MMMNRNLSVFAGLFAILAGASITGCVVKTEVGATGGDPVNFMGGGGAGSGGAGSGSGGAGSGSGSGGSGSGGAGGGGASGPVLLVASTQDMNPWGITIDGANVYFTDAMGINGKVSRVPKAGGPMTLLASGLELPSAVAVDATDVYAITYDYVLRVPIAGGPFTNIAQGGAGFSRLILDDDILYWTDATSGGAVRRMPKAGGGTMHIDDGQDAAGLVLHDGRLYWTSFDGKVVKSALADGTGPVSVFAANQESPRMGLIADDTNLYWMNEGTFPMQLWRGALDGSVPPAQIGAPASDASWAVTFAIDATYLYYPTPDCVLVRVPLAGGPELLTVVDPAVGCPRFIVGDTDDLYYTSDAGVTRFPKSAL